MDDIETFQSLRRRIEVLESRVANHERRIAALELATRLNLRECRGSRGVDVGENQDAVCEVVGTSAAEADPLGWANARDVSGVLIRKGYGTATADDIVSRVFNELRHQWKERGR